MLVSNNSPSGPEVVVLEEAHTVRLYRYMYKGRVVATAESQTTPTTTYRYEHLFIRFCSCENISYLSFLVHYSRCATPHPFYPNHNTHPGRFHQSASLGHSISPVVISVLVIIFLSLIPFVLLILNMPKIDKVPTSQHRNSVSTASAAGGGIRSSSWSVKDDGILIQARTQGLNWNQISPKYFPSKSANACRKRHERLMERQNAEQWDGGVKRDVLSLAYMEVRREMWSILAARVNEKWQLVEQKVNTPISYYLTIAC